MFENIVQQEAVPLIFDDIKKQRLPSSLLFSGPPASGKLTAALELARVLSCEQDGSRDCTCSSCIRQKELSAIDLLLAGTRDTIMEVRAAAAALLRSYRIDVRYLFIRSIRKLTLRFDTRLWDADEPRFLKAVSLLSGIEENLSDVTALYTENMSEKTQKQLQKTVDKLISLCEKLQEDCLYEILPVNQIRKAAAWVRIIPSGRKKVFIVENADQMQESARNAFLKILEEPPEYTVFILTTSRRAAIIPTILSRVRTYTFKERSAEVHKVIIEREFQDYSFCQGAVQPHITAYLESFLDIPAQVFTEAAALFWEYIFVRCGNTSGVLPASLEGVLRCYRESFKAETAPSIAGIVKMINGGKPHRLSVLFLQAVTDFIQKSLRDPDTGAGELEVYAIFSQLIRDAHHSIHHLNMSPQAALENLSQSLFEVITAPRYTAL